MCYFVCFVVYCMRLKFIRRKYTIFDIVTKHIAKNLAYRTAPGRRLQCKGTMSPVSFIVTGS